jgi:signal transduction histidine kinase
MVPIVYGQKIHGTISIIVSDSSRTLTENDLAMAEELGRRAGVAIENAFLYQTAQAAIRTREEFLSIASHELKTPMTALKLLLQMTRKNLTEHPGQVPLNRVVQVFDQANAQVNRLTKLIEDLLDISRIKVGKLSFELAPLNFSNLAREIGENYRPHLQTYGCKLSVTIEEGLMVEGDRSRLEQVVSNVLTNAAKYGEERPVEMKLLRKENNLLLTVKDRGMGIPSDKLHKIFDRFERAVSSTNISGLGLGLFITKEIVSVHRGRIWVESVLGQGSTFFIELPLLNKVS